MDVFDAAYRVAHDYPHRGAVGLAAKLGKNPGTFLNKVNPGQETHQLTLGEAVEMQAISGDHRILHAMAAVLGEACFPLPDLSDLSDQALLELINRIGAEGGDFHREINHSLSDNRICAREFARIEDEAMQFIAAIGEAVARMKGMIDG